IVDSAIFAGSDPTDPNAHPSVSRRTRLAEAITSAGKFSYLMESANSANFCSRVAFWPSPLPAASAEPTKRQRSDRKLSKRTVAETAVAVRARKSRRFMSVSAMKPSNDTDQQVPL